MENLTAQELFDKSVGGIIAQGGPAGRITAGKDFFCEYRSANGRKCAAGQILLDEFYDKKFEDATVSNRNSKLTTALNDSGVAQDQFKLLSDLQTAHDSVAISTRKKAESEATFLEIFKQKALILASRYHLEYKF